ncbi:MAG TPA: hypothetical protein VFX60_18395 [Micromonospora sp.]|nr:hypothetical protein [Micromonospora sp.]
MRRQPPHHQHTTDPTRTPDKSGRRGTDDAEVPARPQVADPPPQQTAFGAPTVGGAVAAAAMAGPGRAEEPDVSDEETVAPGDGVSPDETSTGGQELR